MLQRQIPSQSLTFLAKIEYNARMQPIVANILKEIILCLLVTALQI